MDLALALAEQAIGLTEPNPRVGCVITGTTGEILGQGHTQQVGGPHSEVMALRDAAAAGRSVRGATAWVTLEPCAHHGRTPPCCDALVAAGLARVVVAAGDPNPLVNGEGSRRLRAAGVVVESGTAALDNGLSQWITSPAARADGHAWRRRAGAVLTGVGTVLADDPMLDVRLVPSHGQPLRVVLDSRLRTPPHARLLANAGSPVLIYTTESAPAAAKQALQAAGAEVIVQPAAPDGRLALDRVLADLTQRQVNELHIEAGAELNGAWLRADQVDECLLYLAPTLLGPGRGMAHFQALTRLDDAPRFDLLDAVPVGPDLRVRLTRPTPVGA